MIFITNSYWVEHGNYAGLPPEGQLVAVIIGLLAFLVGYGLYLTLGSGKTI
tara:strand:- start:1927 stop:2079 length:153 start_codon:yes stop_codon:yes gene_type:complete